MSTSVVTRVGNRRWPAAVTALMIVPALVLAGCGSADPNVGAGSAAASFQPVAQEEGSEITIWVDATRVPAVKAYQAAHPDAKIKMVTYSGGANGSNELQTKVQLFDRTGSGWPDVVWPNLQDISWATAGEKPFAAPLDGLVPPSALDGYADGALKLCQVNGKLYCLRNDLAQVVLWYNKPLMAQWGYTVPTTWEEYQALGEKVAREHPGYLVGTAGDAYSEEIYFWASQCPASVLTSEKAVRVDLRDAKCTRMASLLDTLMKAGSMARTTVFDAGFIAKDAAKVLMMPGPSWYGQVLFNETFKTPAGQIAAAPALKFASDPATYTGSVGGGIWMVSSHSKNLKAGADFVRWVTTDANFLKTSGTYPAYKSAAEAWLREQASKNYFAADVAPVFEAAAGQVWPDWAATTQYSQEGIYSSTILPALTAGETLTSKLPDWQTAIEQKARSLGYQVN